VDYSTFEEKRGYEGGVALISYFAQVRPGRPAGWLYAELGDKRVSNPIASFESSSAKVSASTKHHSKAAAPSSNPNVTNSIKKGFNRNG
jgi:hypothetical protein